MISEPELVGGDPFDAPGSGRTVAVPPPPDAVGGGPDPEAAPRPARPWLWAAGGAAVASVLWAGGLYGYSALGPDLGGYRATENLCAEAELKGASAALGRPREDERSHQESSHESLDYAYCSVYLEPIGYEPDTDEEGDEIWSLPNVDITYTLHRKTDPGPEFDGVVMSRNEGLESVHEPRRLSGLGERAYVFEQMGDGAVIEVLDGQATFSLWWSGGTDPDTGEQIGSESDIEPLLMEDLKELMRRLRS
ncbi:hypothetical protein [Streptomyces genisteinicus]|uniref:Uncharacterized protein n=1 Tax=Streptomyces genisteinicus TaxID=2768068 RepID=A0A7H0HWZ3_9ACTN|nr:hypothetical protein [Streptomyces genisteinicus]QNP65059.1 hypothetical protein IAG43_20480 [Streptomyces genisteinicus]